MQDSVLAENQPKCWEKEGSSNKDCSDQEIWRNFYTDFARRRKVGTLIIERNTINTDNSNRMSVDWDFNSAESPVFRFVLSCQFLGWLRR